MANKRFVVKLSSEERKCLEAKISKGRTSAKIILKARILLKARRGQAGRMKKYARRSIPTLRW